MTAEARAFEASGQKPTRLYRFTPTERWVHWIQAVTFLLLLVSGFTLSLSQLEGLIGHRALFREVHLTSAFFFFFGPAIVALSADRQSMAVDVEAVDVWDRDDLRWLVPFPVLRLFGIRTPPQGRFNAGQKLNAIFVVWSTLLFTVTGLIMWQNRRFPFGLVEQSNNIHTVLAYLALLAFLGHLFLATVWPQTRHSLRAITQGWVDSDWARQHHAKWAAQWRSPLAPPAYDWIRAGVQIVLGVAVALFSVRVLFFALGANVTDRVTERLYAVTAWPDTASIHPQTAVRIADWPAIIYLVVCLMAWLAVDRLRRLPSSPSRAEI